MNASLTDNLVCLIVFLPAFGALVLALVPREEKALVRWIALAVASLVFLLSLGLFSEFLNYLSVPQFTERQSWVPSWGIEWHVGIDGFNLMLVLLTTFLTPVVLLSSVSAVEKGVKGYHISMLLLETGMLGALVAFDLFLFYVFWELMLIPMFFLIGVWGGPRRVYAAVKFMLFTLAGSLPMLVALVYTYSWHHQLTGIYTTDLFELMKTSVAMPLETQVWVFGAFALAFAIKVPLFPLHTWLPDAHVEAPTGGSVILAGVLLKLGTYGFARFAIPMFPLGARYLAPLFLGLAAAGIVYGALVSLVQQDIKKLVAYSSVSHLGFVVLGLFSLEVAGWQGAFYGMVSHGLTTGALFLLVGVLYERRHSRGIDDFGGLAKTMPLFAVMLMFATLGSVGLPGLSGFVGEFLVLLSAFHLASKVYVVVSATGLVLGAVYMLWLVQKVLWGPLGARNLKLPDLNPREFCYLAPVILLIVWLGVFPNFWLNTMRATTEAWMSQVDAHRLESAGVDGAQAAIAAAGVRLPAD